MKKTIDNTIEELMKLDNEGSDKIASLRSKQAAARRELSEATEVMKTTNDEKQFTEAAEKAATLKNRILFYEAQLNKAKADNLLMKPEEITALKADLKAEAEALALNTIEKIAPIYESLFNEYMALSEDFSKINTALHLLSRIQGEQYCYDIVNADNLISKYITNNEVQYFAAYLNHRREQLNIAAINKNIIDLRK